MGAIRGAICADNTVADVEEKSVDLIKRILTDNSITVDDVEAVFFSVTDDIDVCYPAKAVREHLDMPNVAFMCFAEMRVKNSLKNCIRVCVLVPKLDQQSCKHCYLGKTRALRSDLK